MSNKRRDFLLSGTSIMAGVLGSVALTPSIKRWTHTNYGEKPRIITINGMMPGNIMAFTWNNKSFYILKRTKEMLESLNTINDQLKDPESRYSLQPENCKNQHRSIKEEYLVVYNHCTRVGNSLMVNNKQETYLKNVGFYCTDEGSRFDFAGRSFIGSPGGPNLHIPHYYYKDDNTIVIDKSIF
ncbi:MAG: ubiquinol-cytochrome c reductase iron-sulfur subunit [Saccharospirillaceae bacterium]|nr:ubiquinol-cytochrome c reductase iron-sulfur subunit [Pseudomonadales bacterium]NRB80080.1 ubiquinol-cytochrome c reductase iron-sulfur subunit [Saccharospirillaceae bacterium]